LRKTLSERKRRKPLQAPKPGHFGGYLLGQLRRMRDKALPDWSIGRLHTEADEKINAGVASRHVTLGTERL
jgi:hypothetical protein